MATGCFVNPALRHQERVTSWCSARESDAQKEHFVAHNARKSIKKNYDGIHDRFERDPENRDSQLKIGWTEEKCIAMEKLAQEDHSYRLSSEEYERSEKLYLTTSEPQSQS